jgi:hypothetical protein
MWKWWVKELNTKRKIEIPKQELEKETLFQIKVLN